MQRLVLKYLHTVSQAVNFHLAEIIGHVRASDKYESVLKFSEESIKKAQTNASIFWAKGIELQQVSFIPRLFCGYLYLSGHLAPHC